MSVVLVTGASSGIGAAIAIAFAEDGWDVMAAGRDEGRLEEVADVSERIVTWTGDLAESGDCDELIADTIDEFGEIDCLVNNAGIYVRGNASETSDDDWRQTMTVNLDVPFFLSRAALPYLLRAEGSIVNIASDWGLRGGERAVSYCASKGGLVLLTKAMARDHARDGLRVNAICPGDVDTPMLDGRSRSTGHRYRRIHGRGLGICPKRARRRTRRSRVTDAVSRQRRGNPYYGHHHRDRRWRRRLSAGEVHSAKDERRRQRR